MTYLHCPNGHGIVGLDEALRLTAGNVTTVDQDTGRSRTERRVTGIVASCPHCGVRQEVAIAAPFVGRRVLERGSEMRGNRMHARVRA